MAATAVVIALVLKTQLTIGLDHYWSPGGAAFSMVIELFPLQLSP